MHSLLFNWFLWNSWDCFLLFSYSANQTGFLQSQSNPIFMVDSVLTLFHGFIFWVLSIKDKPNVWGSWTLKFGSIAKVLNTQNESIFWVFLKPFLVGLNTKVGVLGQWTYVTGLKQLELKVYGSIACVIMDCVELFLWVLCKMKRVAHYDNMFIMRLDLESRIKTRERASAAIEPNFKVLSTPNIGFNELQWIEPKTWTHEKV